MIHPDKPVNPARLRRAWLRQNKTEFTDYLLAFAGAVGILAIVYLIAMFAWIAK